MEIQDYKIVKPYNGVDKRIKSVCSTEICILKPTEKLLQGTFDTNNLRNVMEVYMYLERSKRKLQVLTEALAENRCMDEKVQSQVEHTVKQLERNIPLLENKMDIYKKAILNKNKELKLTCIRSYFKNETEFNTFIQNVTLLYSDPVNNSIYGSFCRKKLVELETVPNLDKLHQMKQECVLKLNRLQRPLKFADSLDNLIVQRDMRQAANSLEYLIKICDIISSTNK